MADGNTAPYRRDLPPKITRLGGQAFNGFAAALVQTGPGIYDNGAWPEHRLIMQTAHAPIGVQCRCDGIVSSRVQVYGDFDLQPAGTPGVWDDDGPSEMMVMSFSPAFLRTTAEGLEMDVARAELNPRMQARDACIEHIALALKAELEGGAPLSRLYGESLGVALTSRVLQRFGAASRSAAHGLSRRQHRRVLDYIDDHLDEDLSLAELAAVAGVSVSHFTVLFRRTTSLSVHRFVVQRRVLRARELLLAGDMSIAQVALETGFAHQSHLARCMRKVVGMTPAEVARCR